MKNQDSYWTSAEAKAALSTVVERAGERPQIIERHGKPAGVVIAWETYIRYQEALEGNMKTLLNELALINKDEEDMDPVERFDRPIPEDIGL